MFVDNNKKIKKENDVIDYVDNGINAKLWMFKLL